MAHLHKPLYPSVKDVGTNPKTPSPHLHAVSATPEPCAPPPEPKSIIPESPRPQRPASIQVIDETPPRARPIAQQSRKRKLQAPPDGAASQLRHLEKLPALTLSPPPPPPPKPKTDPLIRVVEGFKGAQSRRAADMTIALKHRQDSQEMISTHERWSQFCRGPEVARLDLLRTLDDAIAADREILRIVTKELKETLETRERIGRIIDGEVEEQVGKLAAVPVTAGKRVIGRRRRADRTVMIRRIVVLVLLALVAWGVKFFLL